MIGAMLNVDEILNLRNALPQPWRELYHNLLPTNLRAKKFDRYSDADIRACIYALNLIESARGQIACKVRTLVEAAETLADNEESTLSSDETQGNQKRVTPANMFLSVGRSDIREAIREARTLLSDDGDDGDYPEPTYDNRII